jgi:cation:H+ antiporter
MAGMSVPMLIGVFAVGAIVTWIAGVQLAKATDVLDERLNLGEAMGGMVLLAVAGSLPELAITVSGALQGHLGIVAGNLVGGIAMQTMVLAICDFSLRGKRPLSYLVASLGPVIEALLVMLVVVQVILGALLPADTAVAGVSPASIAIILTWVVGLLAINRTRNSLRWSLPAQDADAAPEPAAKASTGGLAKASTGRVVGLFLLASAATLVAGVALENSGNALANAFGISGAVFGATFLALATALPEISTGLAAVKLGDYHLAMSDIFGGNAFQVCLFLLADLLAGQPVLPDVGKANGWLAALGLLITGLFALGVVLRPERRRLRLGADSLLACLAYAIGLVGLVLLTG